MSDQWVVAVDFAQAMYGPFADEETAREFAEYLKVEVDPATVHKLLSPAREVLNSWRRHLDRSRVIYPHNWPPLQGQVWQDRNGKRWICPKDSYLVCIASIADDNAEEIWRHHGPMRLVHFVTPTAEEEVPF